MAGSPSRVAYPRERVDAGARRAERFASPLADGQSRERLSFCRPQRRSWLRRTLRGATPTGRLSLHVRPALGQWLPDLHRLREWAKRPEHAPLARRNLRAHLARTIRETRRLERAPG